MKRCGKCKKPRRNKAFAKDQRRRDGLYPYCRRCQAEYAAKWRKVNHARELAKQRARQQLPAVKHSKRNWHLTKSYGIDLCEYHRLRRRQKGICPICRRYFGNRLVVDHDHRTSRVRGLLCSGCNADIGLFEHDKRIIRRVLKYLAA